MEEQRYLDEINRELEQKYSYLIVRRGEELVYEGNKSSEDSLRDSLPEYDSDVLQSAGSIIIKKEIISLVRNFIKNPSAIHSIIIYIISMLQTKSYGIFLNFLNFV